MHKIRRYVHKRDKGRACGWAHNQRHTGTWWAHTGSKYTHPHLTLADNNKSASYSLLFSNFLHNSLSRRLGSETTTSNCLLYIALL